MDHNDTYVLSIHDQTPAGFLSFDVADVLAALGDKVFAWSWCVQELDATGDVDSFCDSVESQRGKGVWVTSEELLDLAERIVQTIDGKFVAYEKDVDRQALTEADLSTAYFPRNRMQLAILAIDSSYFEVYARNASVESALRARFVDVRVENSSSYFLAE